MRRVQWLVSRANARCVMTLETELTGVSLTRVLRRDPRRPTTRFPSPSSAPLRIRMAEDSVVLDLSMLV
jgi:hypothetical protein